MATMSDIQEVANMGARIGGQFGDGTEYDINHILIEENTLAVNRRWLGSGINKYMDFAYETRRFTLNARAINPISGRACLYVSAVGKTTTDVTIEGQVVHTGSPYLTLSWLTTRGVNSSLYTNNSTTRTQTTTEPRYNQEPQITTQTSTITVISSAIQHLTTRAELDKGGRLINVYGVPVFADRESGQEYINSGYINRGKLLNSGEDTHPLLYIRSKVYSQYREDDPKVLQSHNELEIESFESYYKNICGYVTDKMPHNIQLVWRGGVTFRRRSLTDLVPTWSAWSFDELVADSQITKCYTYSGEYEYAPWGHCIGELVTNIPIFASEQDADDWLDPDIPDEEKPTPLPVPDPPPEPEPEDPDNPSEGEDLDENDTDVSARNIGGAFTTLYTGGLGSILAVAKKLYDPDATAITEIKKAIEFWGENPINFIVRQYYTPIKINDFASINSASNTVYFGRDSFTINGTISKIATSGLVKDFGSALIKGTYDDYRDDMYCSFGLYLPFLGVVPLNKSLYLNKTLSIKVTYDLYTHSMKYYMFSDGKFMESHETNVGVDLPVMGSDYMKKLSDNINGLTSIATGVVSTGIGVSSLVGGATESASELAKNVGAPNIAHGTSSIIDGLSNLLGREETIRSGNISSSTAIHDILYPYIIIETQKTIKPTSNIYGLPDNDINILGSRSGFIKVTDVKLNTNATLEERNMIQSLLSNGVYI